MGKGTSMSSRMSSAPSRSLDEEALAYAKQHVGWGSSADYDPDAPMPPTWLVDKKVAGAKYVSPVDGGSTPTAVKETKKAVLYRVTTEESWGERKTQDVWVPKSTVTTQREVLKEAQSKAARKAVNRAYTNYLHQQVRKTGAKTLTGDSWDKLSAAIKKAGGEPMTRDEFGAQPYQGS